MEKSSSKYEVVREARWKLEEEAKKMKSWGNWASRELLEKEAAMEGENESVEAEAQIWSER